MLGPLDGSCFRVSGARDSSIVVHHGPRARDRGRCHFAFVVLVAVLLLRQDTSSAFTATASVIDDGRLSCG